MTRFDVIPVVQVRRPIAAPAEELFDAWLDPESLAVWMRPDDVQRTTAVVEPWAGGTFEIVMHTRDGPLLHAGTYLVVERPRRLVFTWRSGATGGSDSHVTVEFVPQGEQTEVVVTQRRLPNPGAVASHTAGWTQVLGALAGAMAPPR